MAILIDSAKGKGFAACESGKPQTANPYTSVFNVCEWYEWFEGWQHAYEMGRFGIKGEA